MKIYAWKVSSVNGGPTWVVGAGSTMSEAKSGIYDAVQRQYDDLVRQNDLMEEDDQRFDEIIKALEMSPVVLEGDGMLSIV